MGLSHGDLTELLKTLFFAYGYTMKECCVITLTIHIDTSKLLRHATYVCQYTRSQSLSDIFSISIASSWHYISLCKSKKKIVNMHYDNYFCVHARQLLQCWQATYIVMSLCKQLCWHATQLNMHTCKVIA